MSIVGLKIVKIIERRYPEIYNFMWDIDISLEETKRRRNFILGNGDIYSVLKTIGMFPQDYEHRNDDVIVSIFHLKVLEYLLYNNELVYEKIKLYKL